MTVEFIIIYFIGVFASFFANHYRNKYFFDHYITMFEIGTEHKVLIITAAFLSWFGVIVALIMHFVNVYELLRDKKVR